MKALREAISYVTIAILDILTDGMVMELFEEYIDYKAEVYKPLIEIMEVAEKAEELNPLEVVANISKDLHEEEEE